MTLDDINLVLVALKATDVTNCEIVDGVSTLRLSFDRQARSAPVRETSETAVHPARVKQETLLIRTPNSGVFRHSHPLDDPGNNNRAVQLGQHVGYVEIDSVYCAIVSPANGTVNRVLLQECEVAGYGQPAVELDVHGWDPR
ncbi:biotin carboxyl carrier protein [Paraburkholderia sp. JPY465]|uniref:hypothetical protein n=1 Tax=Paraburkholderia sp. JPY465 TaxID=3042285 RepID=UPI003D1B42BB